LSRLSTVQVDLDGSWVLRQYATGISGSQALSHDRVFATGFPRMLEIFREAGIHATCFVNGADIRDAGKRDLLAQLAAEGHEVASHGVDHSYLHHLDRQQKAAQLRESADLIADLTGARPLGFRAPGFAVDGDVPAVLHEAGYRYDCSAFPTLVTPALAALERCTMGRVVRTPCFWPVIGKQRPYHPCPSNLYRAGDSPLLELPTTTLPLLRLPIHFSYGVLLGALYLRTAVSLALRRLPVVNFVFHLVDFADPVDDAPLPGPGVPLGRRIALARMVVEMLVRGSRVVTCRELVEVDAFAPARA
jgi:hypothetical protein